jgi:hypothetical protein
MNTMHSALYGTFSLSGQTSAMDARNAAPAGGSISMRCPCSIQRAAPGIDAAITARWSFETDLGIFIAGYR